MPDAKTENNKKREVGRSRQFAREILYVAIAILVHLINPWQSITPGTNGASNTGTVEWNLEWEGSR